MGRRAASQERGETASWLVADVRGDDLAVEFANPGLGKAEPGEGRGDRTRAHNLVVGGGEVLFAAGGAERKVVRPEREAAHDDAAGDVARREVVVEPDGGDLVDEVHRDHLGDEGELNGVGRFASESLGGDLGFRLKAAERRKDGGLLAGGGGMRDEEAGGFVRPGEGSAPWETGMGRMRSARRRGR